MRLGQKQCPKCKMITSSSIHDKCFCDEEKKELLKRVFGEIKHESYEDKYDSIMKVAKEIYKFQDDVENPYAMHKAVEYAIREIDKLK